MSNEQNFYKQRYSPALYPHGTSAKVVFSTLEEAVKDWVFYWLTVIHTRADATKALIPPQKGTRVDDRHTSIQERETKEVIRLLAQQYKDGILKKEEAFNQIIDIWMGRAKINYQERIEISPSQTRTQITPSKAVLRQRFCI